MPEGPEIRIISEELAKQLVSLRCNFVQINQLNLFSSDYSLNNGIFEVESLCVRIYNVGKKIVFLFENNLCFVSSCLMYGRWSFKKMENWIICVNFERGIRLYFYDRNANSLFSIVNYGSLNFDHIFKNVGKSYIDCEFDEFLFKVLRKGIRNKHIQDFLLDQKEFSGIGNYLKSEVLYRSRINPLRKMSEFSIDQFELLLNVIKLTMIESYENGGFTFESFQSPSGKRGKFEPLVFMKMTDPEGNPVKKIKDKSNRFTYYVEELQT